MSFDTEGNNVIIACWSRKIIDRKQRKCEVDAGKDVSTSIFLCHFARCNKLFIIFVAHKCVYISQVGSVAQVGVGEPSEACDYMQN